MPLRTPCQATYSPETEWRKIVSSIPESCLAALSETVDALAELDVVQGVASVLRLEGTNA